MLTYYYLFNELDLICRTKWLSKFWLRKRPVEMYLWLLRDFTVTLFVIAAAVGKWQVVSWLMHESGGIFLKPNLILYHIIHVTFFFSSLKYLIEILWNSFENLRIVIQLWLFFGKKIWNVNLSRGWQLSLTFILFLTLP